MSPPAFNDLGKNAKDLFNKGYTHGFLKFDSTTKANPHAGVEFKTNATHNLASQKLNGNIEVKYKIPQHGVILTEKWTTDNTLSTLVEVKDQLAKGLKVTLDTHYAPHTAKRNAVLKTEWSGDLLKVNGDVSLTGGPVLTLAAVVARQGWLFGAQSKVDLSSNEVKNIHASVGRQTPEYNLHTFCLDGREFGASWYHRVQNNVELGAQVGWLVGDHNTRFGLVSKYKVNPGLVLKSKIDNKSQVAIAATHDLSPAVKLTLSTQFGLVSVPDVHNKFGIGLEYNPDASC